MIGTVTCSCARLSGHFELVYLGALGGAFAMFFAILVRLIRNIISDRPLNHSELRLSVRQAWLLLGLGMVGAAIAGAVAAWTIGDLMLTQQQAFWLGVAFGAAFPVVGVSLEQKISRPGGQEPPGNIQALA